MDSRFTCIPLDNNVVFFIFHFLCEADLELRHISHDTFKYNFFFSKMYFTFDKLIQMPQHSFKSKIPLNKGSVYE